ncbi:hypothetical protein IEQ34_014762 [Dendrobium chrysotoxum]|uniref:Uncharacterized protein n=1 Tax=Dendrobium chrysotoxum TaxID=161865 RepID=A0AAV7G426_DENCH|nr:hypothetical protein IEQ34_014762 [Dendrobium chrysotoxum]
MKDCAAAAILGSWPQKRRMRRMESQRKEMGMEAERRRMTVRRRASTRRCGRPAPCDWAQMGSMPAASPDKTEYPVMLAKPIAREPPARGRLPRRPRKNMDIMERE